MKSISQNVHLPSGTVAPEESRFEKLETGPFFDTGACAHFRRKLQKIFPLPPENSEPEDLRVLVNKIQAKLNSSAVAKDR